MIQRFADWLVYGLFGLDSGTRLGEAVNFFFYDTLKIVLLLFVITFLMGVVNSYFPVDKVRNFLSNRKLYGAQYLLAALFGAVTPFCSCSSIPLFIGFVKGGIPLGVTLSFLITSPLVNEVGVAMFLTAFGVKTTAIYAVSGIFIGAVGGWILGRMNMDGELSPLVRGVAKVSGFNIVGVAAADEGSCCCSKEQKAIKNSEKTTLVEKLLDIARETLDIVRSTILYIAVGIGFGAVIHGYVPEGFFEQYLATNSWYSVPLAVVLAVPMYAPHSGVIPVIEVFVAKGIPLGTALAFMMAVIGLSVPEATLLKKVMSWRLIATFFAVVTLSIIALGYLFNAVL
ncbi:MAG: permease [Rikenellaceae bacterium]